MIWKHERLERKLREQGRSASAEILSMRTEGSGNSAKAMFSPDDDLTTSWTLCRLELRVMPEGEPPFEVTVRTRLNTFKYKGDVVPVLYDPADHDKVVVDYEADAQATMEAMDGRRGSAAPLAGADTFAQNAAAFAERAAAFRELVSAITSAKASGNQAEVARLKAELQQRMAENPPGERPA